MRPPVEFGRPRDRHPARISHLAATCAVVIAALVAASRLTLPHSAAPTAATPAYAPAGPSVVQLQKLDALVSARVNVATILAGESRWLRGSWLVRGDALLGVDMTRARVEGVDEQARTAVIVLPTPSVLSARVDHRATREWDVRSSTWIPLAATLLGDPAALRRGAMPEAQRLVEEAAASPEYGLAARRHAESALGQFYAAVGWRVVIRWEPPPPGTD